MGFWNKNKEIERAGVGEEPLDPTALLALVDRIGEACADEVGRQGADADQVMATVRLDDLQHVARVELASDGRPLMVGKGFVRELNALAAPLVNQPVGRRLATIEVTVADGRLHTQIAYSDRT